MDIHRFKIKIDLDDLELAILLDSIDSMKKTLENTGCEKTLEALKKVKEKIKFNI